MTKSRCVCGEGSFHLLDFGIKVVNLWLEKSFELSPLGFECGSKQTVLNGELLWVEVYLFHLD